MKQINDQLEAPAISPGPDQSAARILIVDDDPAVRESLEKVLRQAGYEVRASNDGEQALTNLLDHSPDLLVLDLNMPHRSGWEVFEHVISRLPLLPVIIITGLPSQSQTAIAAGAGALLEKPLDADLLLVKVAELLLEPREQRLRRRCDYLEDTCSADPVGAGYLKRLPKFPSGQLDRG